MRDTFCTKYSIGDTVELNGSSITVTIERIDGDGYYRGGVWCFSDLDIRCKLYPENKERRVS